MVWLRRLLLLPQLALALAACCALAQTAHFQRQNAMRHFGMTQMFPIPHDVGVGMLGLNIDGAEQVHLDERTLKTALSNSLSEHRPTALDNKTGLEISFELVYHVQHGSTEDLLALEKLLSSALQYVGMADGEYLYEVDVAKIEAPLHVLASNIFHDEMQRRDIQGEMHAVVFVNPDRARMTPPPVANTVPKHFRYWYRLSGGTPTQAYVSRRRYIFVDLTAGPCSFGVTNAGEGTVSLGSVPRVTVEATEDGTAGDKGANAKQNYAQVMRELARHTQFMAELTSLVISAVRHVFLPDLRFSQLEFAEKVVVPIVVFRNHNRFNPLVRGAATTAAAAAATSGGLGGANDFSIDVEEIRENVKRLLLPHQQLVLTTGLHDLYDHKHVSRAVFRSIRGDTVHTATPDGHYITKTVPYVDSEILLAELREAEDSLIAGLTVAASTPSSPAAADAADAASRHAAASGQKVFGHRVLPVYVFSLLGMSRDLLLDHRHLFVATNSAVVVLQTGASHVFLPYFNEDGIVFVNPRSPTRHIVGGIVAALGGVAPPYERFAPDKREVVSDYMWAVGYHPFGPFSTSTYVSDVIVDATRRNAAIARADQAARVVRRAATSVGAFTNEFVFDATGASIEWREEASTPAGLALVEQLPSELRWRFLASDVPSPLARSVVERLKDELSRLEEQVVLLSTQLRAGDFAAADKGSGSLLIIAEGFARYVDEEIARAREEMRCCRRMHVVSAVQATPLWMRVAQLFVIAFVGFVVFQLVTSCVRSYRTPSEAKPLSVRDRIELPSLAR